MLLLITVLLIFLSNGSDVAAEPVADCIARELVDFNAEFDASLYKEQVLSDALVTHEDLIEAFREYGRSFQESPPYHAVKEATQRRSELDQLGHLLASCKEEVSRGESAEGTGARLGAMFAKVMEGGTLNSTAVATPKQGVQVFAGIHLEAGALLDVSITAYFSGGVRGCIGWEIGAGIEFSLAILLTGQGDKTCRASGGVDVDAALGLAMGFAFYAACSSNQYEITIGSGIGFGVGPVFCIGPTAG